MTSKQKRGKQAPSLITLLRTHCAPAQVILTHSSNVLQFAFKHAKIKAKQVGQQLCDDKASLS